MGWYMVYMTNAVQRGLSVQDRMGLIEIKAMHMEVEGTLGQEMHVGQELHEQYVEGSLGKDMHMEVEGTLGQEMHVGVEGDPAY